MSRDAHLIEIEAGMAGRLKVVLDGTELRAVRSISFQANKAGELPSVRIELKAQVKARGFIDEPVFKRVQESDANSQA